MRRQTLDTEAICILCFAKNILFFRTYLQIVIARNFCKDMRIFAHTHMFSMYAHMRAFAYAQSRCVTTNTFAYAHINGFEKRRLQNVQTPF